MEDGEDSLDSFVHNDDKAFLDIDLRLFSGHVNDEAITISRYGSCYRAVLR